MNSFASHIFYPESLLSNLRSSHAYLVGWNLDNFKCCIACAVDTKLSHLHKILDDLETLPNCSLMVLGEWYEEIPQNHIPHSNDRMSNIWITLFGHVRPILSSIHSLGSIYKTSCYMFQYPFINTDLFDCLTIDTRNIRLELSQSVLNTVTSQINLAHGLKKTIDFNVGLELGPSKQMDSLSRFPCFINWLETFNLWYMTFISRVVLIVDRKIVTYSSKSLLCSVLFGVHTSVALSEGDIRVSFCDLSLSLASLRDKYHTVWQMMTDCSELSNGQSAPARHRQLLWLAVTRRIIYLWWDTFLGCIVAWLMVTHATPLANYFEVLFSSAQTKLIMEPFVALAHAPLDIKLNTVVTSKLGGILSYVMTLHRCLLQRLAFLNIAVAQLVGCIGCLGFTTQILLAADMMRLVVCPISIIHRILALQHQCQLHLCLSLWHLFNGQKINILRNRVDSCVCDRQQLFCGIVLFVVVVFLFPSTAAYFYLFAALQSGIVLVNFALWLLVILVKEFPYSLVIVQCCRWSVLLLSRLRGTGGVTYNIGALVSEGVTIRLQEDIAPLHRVGRCDGEEDSAVASVPVSMSVSAKSNSDPKLCGRCWTTSEHAHASVATTAVNFNSPTAISGSAAVTVAPVAVNSRSTGNDCSGAKKSTSKQVSFAVNLEQVQRFQPFDFLHDDADDCDESEEEDDVSDCNARINCEVEVEDSCSNSRDGGDDKSGAIRHGSTIGTLSARGEDESEVTSHDGDMTNSCDNCDNSCADDVAETITHEDDIETSTFYLANEDGDCDIDPIEDNQYDSAHEGEDDENEPESGEQQQSHSTSFPFDHKSVTATMILNPPQPNATLSPSDKLKQINSQVIYITLLPTPIRLLNVFSAYSSISTHLLSGQRLGQQVLQSLILGRPALDFHLIKAMTAIESASDQSTQAFEQGDVSGQQQATGVALGESAVRASSSPRDSNWGRNNGADSASTRNNSRRKTTQVVAGLGQQADCGGCGGTRLCTGITVLLCAFMAVMLIVSLITVSGAGGAIMLHKTELLSSTHSLSSSSSSQLVINSQFHFISNLTTRNAIAIVSVAPAMDHHSLTNAVTTPVTTTVTAADLPPPITRNTD